MSRPLNILKLAAATLLAVSCGPDIYDFDSGCANLPRAVSEALLESRGSNVEIRLATGEYHVYPDSLPLMDLKVSNNDNGLRRVAFSFADTKNVRFKGNGARLVFHGEIVPFCLRGCEGFEVEGISIDYAVPFVFEGDVVSADVKTRSVTVRPVTPHVLSVDEDGYFHFAGENWSRISGENIIFDNKTRATYYNCARFHHPFWKSPLKASFNDDGTVTLKGFLSRELPPLPCP